MGLFVKQENERSQLQEKIAAELRQKMGETAGLEPVDGEKADFLENHHETRPAGVIIAVLIAILVAALVIKSFFS